MANTAHVFGESWYPDGKAASHRWRAAVISTPTNSTSNVAMVEQLLSPDSPVIWLGLAVIVLLAAALLRRAVCRLRQRQAAPAADLSIDVGALDAAGPPAGGPQLEVYGVPVRAAVFVLAPVGREGVLPPRSELPDLINQLAPGLLEIFEIHRPQIRFWPEQLSSHGFIQSFCNHAALPGDRGKNTPWCSIAGRFDTGKRRFLAGLICAAAKPNSLGQIVIQQEGMWLDVLRIRR